MKIEWLSTEPNPRTSGMNAAGGWKLHAVNMEERTAVCGLRAAHGWGVDLFIKDKCKRCEKGVSRSSPGPLSKGKDFKTWWERGLSPS